MTATVTGCSTVSDAESRTLSVDPSTTSSNSLVIDGMSSLSALQPAATLIGYTRMLITSRDVSSAADSYVAQPPTLNPRGVQGAEVLFTNTEGTAAIGITIMAVPSPASAPAPLQQSVSTLPFGTVDTGPQSAPVIDDDFSSSISLLLSVLKFRVIFRPSELHRCSLSHVVSSGFLSQIHVISSELRYPSLADISNR